MKFKKDNLVMIPVGGSEQIGMNANLYQFNDKWILVDLGIAFPDETQIGVDILLPDFDFIKNISKNLLGIFITHAHEDHYGAIQYFADEIKCPLWGTEFTLAMLKKKLKEGFVKHNLVLNPYPKNSNIKIGEFEVMPFQNSHSVPQSVSLLVKTKNNITFHTGDWKFSNAKNLNEKPFIKKINNLKKYKITSIVSDSTNSLINGKTPSEDFAYKGLKKVIKKSKGMTIVTCFSSNVSRIKSILEIAKNFDKKICVLGRSLNRSIDSAFEVGLLNKNELFLSIKETQKFNRHQLILICGGSQGEQNSSLSRLTFGKFEKIKLEKGDTVIFSSKKIPGNENSISKIEDKLLEQGINVLNEENKNDIHVSGHPSRDEIKEMYNTLKPEFVIPVHGFRKQLQGNADIAKSCNIKNIFLPRNGDVISFEKNKLSCLENIKMDTKVFDGENVVSINDQKFSIRKQALWNGLISVSIVVNREGELLSVPNITQTGISISEKMKNTLLEISLDIEDFIENIKINKKNSDELIDDNIKKIVNRQIKKNFRVRPIINIHINRIQ